LRRDEADAVVTQTPEPGLQLNLQWLLSREAIEEAVEVEEAGGVGLREAGAVVVEVRLIRLASNQLSQHTSSDLMQVGLATVVAEELEEVDVEHHEDEALLEEAEVVVLEAEPREAQKSSL
jgi:hypothetical protein